ncbi:multidrug resistance-associated ABC transporter [Cyathus striatus]|nr:multidrug resistance-associated ABC transporter [Cyathus striatus]
MMSSSIPLCPTSTSLFDLTDRCTRALWSSVPPAALVVLIGVISLPLPIPNTLGLRKVVDAVKAPFRTYLTLDEAAALIDDSEADNEQDANEEEKLDAPPLWKTLAVAIIGVIQTVFNLLFSVFLFYDNPSSATSPPAFPLLLSIAWLYTSTRLVIKPTAVVAYDLVSIYLFLLLGTLIQLGGDLYELQVYNVPIPPLIAARAVSQLIGTLVVLGVVLNMPMALPSGRVKKEDIGKTASPEDYTSLWGWISFNWIKPLINKGRNTTLNEDDVCNLSPTLRSKAIFGKFFTINHKSLLLRLWAANSLDIFLDFIFTYISIMLNYARPFFLQRILEAIDRPDPTPESRMKAYIYAFLAFFCTLFKAESDLQHLWFGRRSATRMRSELMAAIYDKALKRRDYSGVVDKEKVEEERKRKEAAMAPTDKKSKDKKEKEDKEKSNDPKAGADIGKIVNLMAGDATMICDTMTGLFFLYGSPFEIIIAGYYLYKLLGLSAFTGFIVLIAGWPLNSYLARRSINIQKSLLGAKDKRMAVLTELLSSVKFIKFFAWEDKWTQRALDAREVEMKWLVKERINSVLFYLLWTSSPILVSIVSFYTYVIRGNELTVSVAFTAITLFTMIRLPLNVIPAYIVEVLQAGVALKRISVYLDEDEVDEQVSSLKNSSEPSNTSEEQGFGLRNATLKWNEVPEEKEDIKGKSKDARSTSLPGDSASIATASTTVGDNVDLFADAPGDHRFELKDINVIFPEGKLTVITGPTASGKTALLMALLGEMTMVHGKLIMMKNPSSVDENGNVHAISYAAQTPWLRHQSIKDNILFGYPYDEKRYSDVIEACALNPDLAILEDGDSTEIGARGVSLSGGQKARVALARAAYARTKYILLDDPLSAVDSHTSRFLYEKLLRGPLLDKRTVILVTHHVELVLPGAHYLVRMLDGRIDTQGFVEELRVQGLLEEITHDAEVEVQKEEKIEEELKAVEEAGDPAGETKKPRKLVEDEHRETGGVKWPIYKSYLKASSYWIWAFLLFLMTVSEVLGVAEKFWIKIWGDAYPKEAQFSPVFTIQFIDRHSNHNSYQGMIPYLRIFTNSLFGIELPSAIDRPLFYVSIYAAIGLGTAIIVVFSITAQYIGSIRASRKLFKQLLVTVVRATFRFHDTTPQGRMMNRFGKDIQTIDYRLAGSLQAVNSSLAGFFAAIITVAIVFPYFLIPAFFIGFAYRELSIGYLNTGRDLRRMESNSRSPIFSDFGELLEGIVTVRAYSAERRFLNNLHLKIDHTTKMWYSFWMTNRWLLLNFDFFGALAVLVTTLFSIATLNNSAGLAGVSITSAMSFTMSVYWACRFWTALELDLNSVERIVEYLDLPQEPPSIVDSNRVPAYWPSSSNKDTLISVENLTVKYAPELPAVLQDVSFTLKAGERVGLLGRTGSGKSTLAMSILRFVDPASGRIVIDGIDISTIGIHDLRSRLTFIPQDATLFSGTLRDNLDPFGDHEDSDCLDVLYRVHLITPGSTNASERASRDQSASSSRVPSRPASVTGVNRESTEVDTIASSVTDVESKTKLSLETQVSAGGANFSQGQRQLIAMARALLRHSSIIVLDEATSSIDFATDAKIQTAIREEFTDSLLLTVAHRLRTVIDYDRLIVLDKGKISEFDTPWNLIQKEDGIFRNMCLKSGQYSELEAAAKAKAEQDQG